MEKKKKCKYCKFEINKNAKVCPNCKKKQNVKKSIIIISIILFFIIAIVVDSNNGKNGTEINKNKIIGMGEKITINNVDYVVNEKVIQKELSVSGGLLKYTADGSYLLIKLTITNNSKKSININATDFRLKDENGATYASSTLISVDNMDMFNFETLNPNATESGYIAYDIANTDLHYILFIDGDDFFDMASVEVPIQ